MELSQAITLAVLLFEWEIEQAELDQRGEWRQECFLAAKTLRAAKTDLLRVCAKQRVTGEQAALWPEGVAPRG